MHKMQIEWYRAVDIHQFKAMLFYNMLIDDGQRAPWRKVIQGNKSRPRVVHCLWLACHGKFTTKARLQKFFMVDNATCSLCNTTNEMLIIFFSVARKLNPFGVK